MMGAALIREENKDAYVVSILPSTAGKYEISRNEFEGQVDAVLTTREFARMLKKNKVILRDIEDKELDAFKGYGKMFGAVGVETMATLQQASSILTGSSIDLDINSIRSLEENITEATVNLNGQDLNVAVVHGGRGLRRMFEILSLNKKQYHFIEVQDNFGGLLNSGGQPIVQEEFLLGTNVAEIRTLGYEIEADLPQNNPFVKAVYDNKLSKPGSNEAYKLLHTKFSKKSFRRE
jgi:iron only hydrogenase large subunit-like protein